MFDFIWRNFFLLGIRKFIMSFYYSFKYQKNKLYIGYNCYIKNCTFGKYNSIYNNILVDTYLGDFTYISKNTEIHNADIGKYTSIGQNSQIGLSSHPIKNYVALHPAFYTTNSYMKDMITDDNYYDDSIKKTLIGNDVWIGANVLIAGGISIGDGAVIGMGAVVVQDIPPYAIVGGVPAKVIRYRFNEEQIEFLLKNTWWDKPLDKRNTILFRDINDFIINIK